MIVQFTIPGEPVGKGRARIVTNKYTGKAHGVTPHKSVTYENHVKLMFCNAGHKPTDEEYKGEIQITVECFYGIPKSKSKKEKALMLSGDILPTKKPDVDNVLKIICDSLNGIAYHDDSQIVLACIEKRYSELPEVKVTLNYLKRVKNDE